MARGKKTKESADQLVGLVTQDIYNMLDNTDWVERPSGVVVPSGFFELDQILFCGVGGFITGCRYEVYGEPGTCKTTFSYRVIGQAQRQFPNKKALLVDTEKANRKELIRKWAIVHGAIPERIDIFRPEDLSSAYRGMAQLISTGEYCIAVWDSVGATIATAVDDIKKYDPAKQQMAEAARMNSRACKILRDVVFDTDTLFLALNQATTNITAWRPAGAPPKLISPGGLGYHHMLDVQIFFRNSSVIYEDGEIVGQEIRAEIEKSHVFTKGKKTGPRGDCPDMRIYFDGRPADYTENLVDMAVAKGIIEKAGPYYTYMEKKVQGKKPLIEMCRPLQDQLWESIQRTQDTIILSEEEDNTTAIAAEEEIEW